MKQPTDKKKQQQKQEEENTILEMNTEYTLIEQNKI